MSAYEPVSYYESAEDVIIDIKRALQELDAHGVPESERETFFQEVGFKPEYDAQEVLRWLGY